MGEEPRRRLCVAAAHHRHRMARGDREYVEGADVGVLNPEAAGGVGVGRVALLPARTQQVDLRLRHRDPLRVLGDASQQQRHGQHSQQPFEQQQLVFLLRRRQQQRLLLLLLLLFSQQL